ncbi:MAG: hypothetical protein KJO79_02030, partial [Verrucomicrobiae bacterium]|nr:hypothetical protein [Verrucomicrobiae bacterium]NNJ85931.1 hypothetical protein [Akkermansiaceae bacterium]
MKVPLEPIPTQQIVVVEKDTPHTEITVDEGVGQKTDDGTSQLDRAYPWLLGASTCLSALLC